MQTTDFFEKDVQGQKAILASFYQEAVHQALLWQESSKRHAIVPEKIWHGRDFQTTARLEYPQKIFPVTQDVIPALKQQDILLSSLEKTIYELAPQVGLHKPYIKRNQSGWSYRGLWMKLRTGEPDDVIPEGSFPFMFKIDLYNRPTLLRFTSPTKEIVLDLEENYYFSLDETNQKKTIVDYLWPILKQM